MNALCSYNNFSLPAEKFDVLTMNSPACLLHWRVLVMIVDALSIRNKSKFQSFCERSLSSPQGRSKQRSATSLPQVVGASTVTEATSETVSSEIMMITEPSVAEVNLPVQNPESAQMILESFDPLMICDAIDSHMHLDRTGAQLKCRSKLHATLCEILSKPQPVAPISKVSLLGVVAVYCDPDKYPESLPSNPRIKVAVGVHPRKINFFNADSKSAFLNFISNPRVIPVGEIGLDLMEPEETWHLQLEVLTEIIQKTLGEFTKPLVLHIRDNPKFPDRNPYLKAFSLLDGLCGSHRPIHLHCFAGTTEDVLSWRTRFQNCYFSFTGAVARFSKIQLDALKAVPLNRLLLETDAPYLSPVRGVYTNTPAYIGDVGWLVSRGREVEYSKLMYWALQNTKELYKFE